MLDLGTQPGARPYPKAHRRWAWCYYDATADAAAVATGRSDQPCGVTLPTVGYIQGVQGNSKRIWSNSLGPYDSTEKVNDLMGTTENYRCITYRRDDPDAVDEPGRP